MMPEELRDYQLLRQIQALCYKAKEWGGPVSFENIWQACSDEFSVLKTEIGRRIVFEYDESESDDE